MINDIIELMKTLEHEGCDWFSYEFGNGKAIYIQVSYLADGIEYMYEADHIINEEYEPYSDLNASSPFGDYEKAKEVLEQFIDEYKLNAI